MATQFWKAYQPKALDDMPLDPGVRRYLTQLQERGTLTDLLLVGPDEAEPMHLAQVFAEGFDAHIREVSSLGGGPDSMNLKEVRRGLRLGTNLVQADQRVVVLERVDQMPRAALESLGRLLRTDHRASDCYLIAECRSAVDLPHPFRSALTRVSVPTPPPDEVQRVLEAVLAEVGVEPDSAEVGPWTRLHLSVPEILRRMEYARVRTGSLAPDLDRDSAWRTARQLLEESGFEGEVPWMYAPLVATNRLSILYGTPGVAGKSTFSRHLAAAKTQGRPFLGEELKAGRVAWISVGGEEVKDDIVRGLDRLGADLDRVLVRTDPDPDLRAVVRTVIAQRMELVILDRLSSFAGISDEASNVKWRKWAAHALPLIRESGAAWLGIHQARKAPGSEARAVRGGSEIVAIGDIAARLDTYHGRSRRPNRRVLRVEASRYGLASPIYYRLREYDGRFERVEAVGRADASETRAAILDAVGSDWSTQDEIEERLEDAGYAVSQSTVYRTVTDLDKRGDLERKGEGKRGDPHRYRQADPSEADAAAD